MTDDSERSRQLKADISEGINTFAFSLQRMAEAFERAAKALERSIAQENEGEEWKQ